MTTTVAIDAAGDGKEIAGMTAEVSVGVANVVVPEAEVEADDLIATAPVMIAPVAMVRAEIVRVAIVPGRKVVAMIAVAEIVGKAGIAAMVAGVDATSATGATGRARKPAPAGITAAIEPSGPAIEGLTRHIRETFRSFPLADLAKMVLEARERYRIRFTASEPAKLYQCLADASLWLSREEAIQHVLSGPALEHFYTAEDVSVDPPRGTSR